jgi:hypothetical protein
MVIALIPLFIFVFLCAASLGDNIGISTLLLSGISGLFGFSLGIGWLFCTFGLRTIFRTMYPERLCKALSVVGGCIPPVSGILLLPIMIHRKFYFSVVFTLAGVLIYGGFFCGMLNVLPALSGGNLCFLLALAFFKDGADFSWHFIKPLIISVSFCIFLLGYDVKLQMDMKSKQAVLSQITGCPANLEEFWEREKQGFPLDRDPLKTLVEKNPENVEFDSTGTYDSASAKKILTEIEQNHPDFIKALEDFWELEPHYVAHQKTEYGLIISILQPELTAFRHGAYISSLQMIADPCNKPKVFKYNRNLTKLRDWLLQSQVLLSHAVAISIERIRIITLKYVLESGQYSNIEFKQLVGEPVNWETSLHLAWGNDATSFSIDKLYLKIYSIDPEFTPAIISALSPNMPLFVHIQSLRDNCFALDYFIKLCSVKADLSALEKYHQTRLDEKAMQRNFFIMSAMLLPANAVYKNYASIIDTRRMALLAAEVMEYRKQHGKLPEDLSFLSKVPLAKLDHKPLMYEKTKDGFRIFSHTDKGEKPDEKDLQYSYRVRLLSGNV